MSTYSEFCKYIKDTFFNDSMKGSYVSLIIDDKFINDACRSLGAKKQTLIESIRDFMYHHLRDNLENDNTLALGIIAIQLYTAYIRGDEAGNKGYRTALANLLGVYGVEAIKDWMEWNQEQVWNSFYKWCNKNDFQVYHTDSSYGPWRYVRYILDSAKNTLNQRDLKTFGYDFVQHGLTPDEEMSEDDFWRALGGRSELAYCNWHTPRSNNILCSHLNDKSIFTQVYSYFYFHWDGSYTEPYTTRVRRVANLSEYSLYLSTEKNCLDVRDGSFNKIFKIELNKSFDKAIKTYYREKRKGVIVFKPSDDYNNYWEETRYIDNGDEGLALIRNDRYASRYSYLKVIGIYANWKLVEIKRTRLGLTNEFFASEEKPFVLEGGLKVDFHQYLKGGEPMIKVIRETKFWIDGEPFDCDEPNEYILTLDVGKHIIKFLGYSPVAITIVDQKIKTSEWLDSYTKWEVDKKECFVRPEKLSESNSDESFVGLDFSKLLEVEQVSLPTTTRWIMAHQGKGFDNEPNPIIKQIKKINANGRRY